MKKVLITLLVFIGLIFGFKVFAAGNCFVIINPATGKIMQETGSGCNARITPCATFAVALSLMGFDANILRNTRRPVWNYSSIYGRRLRQWKHYKKLYYGNGWGKWVRAKSPATWIRDSCLWYSQILAEKLGIEELQNYVNMFSYGNRDLSGKVRKKNGFIYAWSNSSLKISPFEQVIFLAKMLNRSMFLTEDAYDMTEQLLYITTLTNGWKLYGKTGNCYQLNKRGRADPYKQLGWFVGWVAKGPQIYIFARLMHVNKRTTTEASHMAEGEANLLLLKSGLLK